MTEVSPRTGAHRASRRAARRRRPTKRRRILRIFELLAAGFLVALVWPAGFGGWVSYSEVSGHSMLPTYQSGDFVVAVAAPSYAVGDPVVYRVPKGQVGAGLRIIHRIVGGNMSTGFTMKGDNNATVDPWKPRRGDILGRVVLHCPNAGRWVAWGTQPVNLGILSASITITCILWPGAAPRSSRHRRSRPARSSKRSRAQLPSVDPLTRGASRRQAR